MAAADEAAVVPVDAAAGVTAGVAAEAGAVDAAAGPAEAPPCEIQIIKSSKGFIIESVRGNSCRESAPSSTMHVKRLIRRVHMWFGTLLEVHCKHTGDQTCQVCGMTPLLDRSFEFGS